MTGFRGNRRSRDGQDGATEIFAPIAYRLDGKRLLDLPLKLTTKVAGGAKETRPTTIAGALYHLAPSPENERSTSIQEVLSQAVRAIINRRDATWHAKDGEFMVGTAYNTTQGEIVLTGSDFAREVLSTLLDFQERKRRPFRDGLVLVRIAITICWNGGMGWAHILRRGWRSHRPRMCDVHRRPRERD